MITPHLFLRSPIRSFASAVFVFILIGCATSGSDLKTGSTSVKALTQPQWREGDTWIHHGPKGQLITEVERADDSEMILRAGKLRFYYDHEFGLLKETSDDKLTLEYHPPYKGWRFFPLWIGKEWENRWEEKNHKEGSVLSFAEKAKVIGWENIITYAGTFRALRIDLVRTNLGSQKRYNRTVWYAPETKSFIRVIWKEMSERDQTLSEFKQRPGGSQPSKPVVSKPQPSPPKTVQEEKGTQKEGKRIVPTDQDERLGKRLDEIYDLMVKENYLPPEELKEVYDMPISDLLLLARLKILADATEYDYLPFPPMFYLALEKEDYDDAELIRRNWVTWLHRISEFLGPYSHVEVKITKVIEKANLHIEKLEIVGLTDPLLVRLRKELTYALDGRQWDDAQKIQSLIVSRTEELRLKQPRELRPARVERGDGRPDQRTGKVAGKPPAPPERGSTLSGLSSQEQQDRGGESQRPGADGFTKVLERFGGKPPEKATVSSSEAPDPQAGGDGSSEYLTEDVSRALRLIKGKGTEKELTTKEKGTLQLIDVLLGVMKKK